MSDSSFVALGAERFVSLTTFRRSGAGVSTAMWIAPDGDALVATTGADTAKVKRLRHTARVELRPCSRLGKVADGAPTVSGVAEVLTDLASQERGTGLIRRKYGIQYRIVAAVERLARRGRSTPRAILRIRPG